MCFTLKLIKLGLSYWLYGSHIYVKLTQSLLCSFWTPNFIWTICFLWLFVKWNILKWSLFIANSILFELKVPLTDVLAWIACMLAWWVLMKQKRCIRIIAIGDPLSLATPLWWTCMYVNFVYKVDLYIGTRLVSHNYVMRVAPALFIKV